jgi:hypothetical protein
MNFFFKITSPYRGLNFIISPADLFFETRLGLLARCGLMVCTMGGHRPSLMVAMLDFCLVERERMKEEKVAFP